LALELRVSRHHDEGMSEVVAAIDPTECLARLSAHSVGRLCVLENGYPVALPVNYRLVGGPAGEARVVIRVRKGSTLDRSGERVSIQIDGTDFETDSGWAVVLRGTLRQATATDDWLVGNDPRPWVSGRDIWQYIEATTITGRVISKPALTWELSLHGYL
jgi:hypothetical protein